MQRGVGKLYYMRLAMTDFRSVSAPGKALIAGGYLILDPEQIGLALALSARIYVVIFEDDAGAPPEGKIAVSSPQFNLADWKYECMIDGSETLHVKDVYVPLTLRSSFQFERRTKRLRPNHGLLCPFLPRLSSCHSQLYCHYSCRQRLLYPSSVCKLRVSQVSRSIQKSWEIYLRSSKDWSRLLSRVNHGSHRRSPQILRRHRL